MLIDLQPEEFDEAPSVEEYENHLEYSQVVLDVNRSIKRFPPGIPYESRVAMQDQLVRLILRVIMKYPQLQYYQVKTIHTRLFIDHFLELMIFLKNLGLSRCGNYIPISGRRKHSIPHYGETFHKPFETFYGTDDGENLGIARIYISSIESYSSGIM